MWAEILNRHFSPKAQETMLNIADCQRSRIKTVGRHHITLAKWPPLKSLQATNAGEGVEKREPSCTAVHACSVMSFSLRPQGVQPARLLCPRDSPGQNTRAGCHLLLQGIFLTQELSLHVLHWQVDASACAHTYTCAHTQMHTRARAHNGLLFSHKKMK